MIGYFKCDKNIQSEEFQELDREIQRVLFADTKPTYEIISVRYFDLLENNSLIPVPYTLNSRMFPLMMSLLCIA